MFPEQLGAVHPSDRDWPEDFGHENGKYQNLCISCDQLFLGHKRRVICRKCVRRCPKCGGELITNGENLWCSFVGGRGEKACDYGLDGSVKVQRED